MLTLTRKLGEDVIISDSNLNIIARVRIDKLCGETGQRRAILAISANPHLNIDRGEVYDQKVKRVVEAIRSPVNPS